MGSSISVYVGIDLAIAKGKLLPIVMCEWRGDRCMPLPLRSVGIDPPRGRGNAAVLDSRAVSEFVDETEHYLRAVSDQLGVTIKRIGIDAPRGPAEREGLRRVSESRLYREGISCFATPSEDQFDRILEKVRVHLGTGGAEARIPHANQLWMLVGFQLFDRLAQITECLEVYPQLTVQVLGAGGVHKSQKGAVQTQLNAVAQHTGWPCGVAGETGFSEIAHGPSHDRLDAYLAAWVAALPEADRIALGEPPDDAIWAPKIREPRFKIEPANAPPMRPNNPRGEKHSSDDHSLICPGCGTHRFKRWPFGWDAHAAYKCPGVKGATPNERKQNFKQRFERYF